MTYFSAVAATIGSFLHVLLPTYYLLGMFIMFHLHKRTRVGANFPQESL